MTRQLFLTFILCVILAISCVPQQKQQILAVDRSYEIKTVIGDNQNSHQSFIIINDEGIIRSDNINWKIGGNISDSNSEMVMVDPGKKIIYIVFENNENINNSGYCTPTRRIYTGYNKCTSRFYDADRINNNYPLDNYLVRLNEETVYQAVNATGLIKIAENYYANHPEIGQQEKHKDIELNNDKEKFIEDHRQAIIKSGVGARVCNFKNNGIGILIGFVEAISPDKKKVQIRTSFLQPQALSPQLIPLGRDSQIVWDDPGKWRLCN